MNRTHFFKRPSNTMVRNFISVHILAYLLALRPQGRGGEQNNVDMFIRGGSAPRSNSLHFYEPFFYVKGNPFAYLRLTNGITFTDLI